MERTMVISLGKQRKDKIGTGHIEAAVAKERYARALAEFQRAADAENRLLRNEFPLSSEPPYFQPDSGLLAPFEVVRQKTSETLFSFNQAAAIYRKSRRPKPSRRGFSS